MKFSNSTKKEKPDVVHHVAMKPVVYGTIAARMAGIKMYC
ncbi:MAG: hypothetical protein H6925_06420 [Holosporaceae bacterium]|nr:MAG: hypothetical protein H6925_06420 [Holosporaceae bacterium]